MNINEGFGAEKPAPSINLGHPVVCLNVANIHSSVDFYSKLDFKLTGGEIGEGWATLRNPSCELHLFQGHIDDDLLNFRGGDVFAIEAQLKANGFVFAKAAKREQDNSVGAELRDPAGLCVYFNSTIEEMQGYTAKEKPFPATGEPSPPFGEFLWSLPVEDAGACVEFYERLGFRRSLEDVSEDGKWFELEAPGTNQFKIGFSQGISPGRMLMFFGGDVYAIEKQITGNGLKMDIPAQLGFDGVDSMMILDPDGNMVCFHGPVPAPEGETGGE